MEISHDYLVEILLLVLCVGCFGLLVFLTGHLLFYVACGLFFMGTMAYTLLQGQSAERPAKKLAWFVCTGVVFFLFSYWALQVVFRPPKNQNTQGCGGVQFIHHEEL